jgi:hypothetical protein
VDGLDGEYLKVFIHALWSRLDISDNRTYNLLKLHFTWWATAFFFFFWRKGAIKESRNRNEARLQTQEYRGKEPCSIGERLGRLSHGKSLSGVWSNTPERKEPHPNSSAL